jgi:hypothetical protein
MKIISFIEEDTVIEKILCHCGRGGNRPFGLTPVLHRRTPPNDECISYRQLVVAGARRNSK